MVSVNTSNLGSLQGMPDVEFDFGVSAELKRVFRAAATALNERDHHLHRRHPA